MWVCCCNSSKLTKFTTFGSFLYETYNYRNYPPSHRCTSIPAQHIAFPPKHVIRNSLPHARKSFHLIAAVVRPPIKIKLTIQLLTSPYISLPTWPIHGFRSFCLKLQLIEQQSIHSWNSFTCRSWAFARFVMRLAPFLDGTWLDPKDRNNFPASSSSPSAGTDLTELPRTGTRPSRPGKLQKLHAHHNQIIVNFQNNQLGTQVGNYIY